MIPASRENGGIPAARRDSASASQNASSSPERIARITGCSGWCVCSSANPGRSPACRPARPATCRISWNDRSAARKFVSILEKHQWILEKQAEWRAYERARARAAPRYCNGGHIRFLGKRITLRTNPYTDRYRRTHFLLAEDELWIAGPGVDDPEWIERKVTGWMKQQARALFAQRMIPFACQLGKGPTEWALSSARSRWGSCSPEGKILLSWRLIHFPLHIIDYVIAHEIAHLKELNHGPRFWATVEQLLPGHQAARDELRRYPDGLLPA